MANLKYRSFLRDFPFNIGSSETLVKLTVCISPVSTAGLTTCVCNPMLDPEAVVSA